MSVFDQIAQRNLRENPETFPHWLLPDLMRKYHFTMVHDARITVPPSESDRTCDIVATVVNMSDSDDTRLQSSTFATFPPRTAQTGTAPSGAPPWHTYFASVGMGHCLVECNRLDINI